MPLWGAFLGILLDCAVAVRGGARGGGRRFPPPCPARRPQGIAPTDAPVGHVQRIPVCAVIYFHNNDGTGVWVDGARCGGRRFPPPGPARRPQGIAPTDAPVGRVPANPVGLRRGGSWRRALWWATIPPAVPRQATTRDRPYGGDAPVGHVRRVPVCAVIYFHNNDGTGVWVDGARVGGRRFPPPGPARRPQGIAPTGGMPLWGMSGGFPFAR